jgi:hypothetical protein
MTDEKKVDPFKPQQPAIPGVAPGEPKAKPEAPPSPELASTSPQENGIPAALIASLAVGVLLLIGGVIFWSHLSSSKPVSASAETPAPAAAPAPKAAANEPVGPGPVATTDELAKAWSSKRFMFRNTLSGQIEPAMVVRLPRGDYWGFSLLEPFGNCELEYVGDLDKLRNEYHYRADHPMVGDPCNHTVYDLLKYGGGASSDELVRGEIVQGNGIRPPMAIEIRADGKQIIAVRGE